MFTMPWAVMSITSSPSRTEMMPTTWPALSRTQTVWSRFTGHAESPTPVELRAFLRNNNLTLSETWSYILSPD